MKIVFVHFGRENIGIEYLSAILKEGGHQVDLVCDPGLFSIEDNIFYSPFLENIFKKRNIVESVIHKKPDMVAFSVYTTTYKWACKIAEEIKKYTSVPIVFGGIHCTLVPEKVISQPFIDYVHIGEGEHTFLGLINSLSHHDSIQEVNNIFYKRNGKTMSNPLRESISDLDNLPFPDKELFADFINYKDDYIILASRGCPFSCSYCCESFLNKLYKNKYFRRRRAESVIEELKIMKKKYNFREVMFFDSVLFNDKKWLKNLLSSYKQEIHSPFRCTGHVNFLDYETGKLLKDGGCYCIDFGVQTFNQKLRIEILDRREDNEQIKKAFKICDDLQLRYDVDLIFGLPGMSEADYLLPLHVMEKNKFLNRFKCFYLSYYPKLPITDKAHEIGILEQKDIKNIENGITGDWFHLASIKSSEQKRWKNIFSKIYKIYPLLPNYAKRMLAQKKLYKWFYLIPNFVIIFLQLLIGVKTKDYRFKIYINNYLRNFKKKLLGKL